jgi:uncharacterized protein (TIGR03437 family)
LSGSPVRRGFLTVLEPASQILYSTVTDGEVLSTSVDVNGGIWFSGDDRLSRLTRGRTVLDYSQLLGGAGGRFSRNSGFLLWYPTDTVTELEFAAEQTPQMLAVSPVPIRVGDVMTVTGIGIGPAEQKNAEIGPDGVLAEDVDSVRVFFNGLSGKMVKAGPDQLEVIVAGGIVGFGETLIDVTHGYDIVASRVVKIEDPAVRPLGVTNADGTSTAQIPAHAGDIVSAYVWDPGVVDPACAAGAVSFAPAPLNVAVSATLDDKPGRITYAGTVPGYLCGLKQVNVEVPQVSRYTYEMNLNIGSVSLSMPVLVDWLR